MPPLRLFIVEDERIIALALQDRLERAGFTVLGNVGTASKALELVPERCPDLVLMDIDLGRGPDGIDVATRLLDRCEASVVFVSARSDAPTLARARAVSGFPILAKPLRIPVLREVARSLGLLPTEPLRP